MWCLVSAHINLGSVLAVLQCLADRRVYRIRQIICPLLFTVADWVRFKRMREDIRNGSSIRLSYCLCDQAGVTTQTWVKYGYEDPSFIKKNKTLSKMNLICLESLDLPLWIDILFKTLTQRFDVEFSSVNVSILKDRQHHHILIADVPITL